ncbi:MAG: D-glycero-beta-D-manno-heptose-7-phosphate kinase [Gemmatimonadaceae bacterium]
MPIKRERLVELFERVKGKRILVIGDAMLDVYLTGDVERISPEAPVPVVRVRERKNALGGAANVAQNVVAVGADCELVAAVGRDSGGETLRLLAQSMRVDAGSLILVDRPTTTKTRIVARSQQLVRVDEEDDHDLAAEHVAQLKHAIETSIGRSDAVILEDYDKGVLSADIIRYVMELASERDTPVVVDPKYRNFFEYRGATIFKPNVRELEAALGAGMNLDDPSTLPSMVRRLGVHYLLLTLGERGMALYSIEGEIARVPTHAREVYDVVGAGDTVTAYLASMLAAGASVSEAAIIANIAAGIEVGKLGAATVSSAEILAFAAEHSSESLATS